MGKAAKKLSKLERGKTKSLVLTDRDAEILQALYKYRFLTTEHLMHLTGAPSIQAMNKRLRRLFDHKYTDRPKAQHAIFSHAKKRPTIHALGNEGARLLSNRFGIPMPPTVYWTEKNRRVREKHIEHTIGISDFMVSVELACKKAGNIRVIEKDEILARSPEQTKRVEHPFRWQTEIMHGGQRHSIAIVPDYVFGLHYEDKPEGKNRSFFFVEIDRGTMPIVRRDIRQTSFMRKMQSYADSWHRKLPLQRFGINAFRVLTITTSQDRIQTMIEAYNAELKERVPAGVYLFATKDDSRNGIRIWVNANSRPIKIVSE